MTAPRPSPLRHRVDPGDVPADKAARRLHLTEAEFAAKLPILLERGFPPADPTTGMYDLDAIDLWRKARNPRLYGLTPIPGIAEPTQRASLGERFRAAKERKRHDPAA